MGTRAHHASAGQSPACCLKGKETKAKKKKNKTRPRLKTKMTQKEFAQLKVLWKFAGCGSLMIVLVNALQSKNVFEGICSISTCSYCQLFLFVRVTCDNCRGQRPPLQELAKFDGTRGQLQSAASLLFHFLPKGSLSKSFKNIYLNLPAVPNTPWCGDKWVCRKKWCGEKRCTHWHNACRNHARSGFQKIPENFLHELTTKCTHRLCLNDFLGPMPVRPFHASYSLEQVFMSRDSTTFVHQAEI